MSVDKNDFINTIYEAGFILPEELMLEREFSYRQINGVFRDKHLANRFRICPSLFEVNSNVFITEKYHHLNIKQIERLNENFPEYEFESFGDVLAFAEQPQFYLVADNNGLEGDDLLGNEYNESPLVFMRICPNNPLGDFELYSVEELAASFLNYLDFVDPHSREEQLFLKSDIYRFYALLDDILEDIEGDGDTETTRESAIFYDILESIRTGVARQFRIIEKIKNYAIENSELSKEFFTRIFDVAMRMRGWDGQKDYPLKSNSTGDKVNNSDTTERLHAIYLDCSNKYKKLSMLPIFRYTSQKKFKPSVSDGIGRNIITKIRIVLENKSVDACIRVSSNWLAISAWYYMNEFFQETLFNIDDLDEIQ